MTSPSRPAREASIAKYKATREAALKVRAAAVAANEAKKAAKAQTRAKSDVHSLFSVDSVNANQHKMQAAMTNASSTQQWRIPKRKRSVGQAGSAVSQRKRNRFCA